MDEETSALKYWKNGNTHVPVNLGYKENSKPFVVSIREPGCICANLLVFATDEKHALERVTTSLKECSEKEYVRENEYDNRRKYKIENYKKLATGKFIVKVEEYNKKVMCSIAWASNDTCFG